MHIARCALKPPLVKSRSAESRIYRKFDISIFLRDKYGQEAAGAVEPRYVLLTDALTGISELAMAKQLLSLVASSFPTTWSIDQFQCAVPRLMLLDTTCTYDGP